MLKWTLEIQVESNCKFLSFLTADTDQTTDYQLINRDLVFIQDCTGSQGTYISSATKNIESICAHIFESGKLQSPEDLRVGLVAFRDHPPQDHTYITKNFGFSSDISQVHKHLSGLYASGGGDGPEAVTAALAEALNMDWREYASKMVVLIADAPPHGIGEYGDGQYYRFLIYIYYYFAQLPGYLFRIWWRFSRW